MESHNSNSKKLYFIGLNLQTPLFLEDSRWLSIFKLKGFDPEENFPNLLESSNQLIQNSIKSENIGGTLHFGSTYDFLQNDWVLDPLIHSLGAYMKAHQFYPVVHMCFRDNQLPFQPDFQSTLRNEISAAAKLHAPAMVLHAPRTEENTSAQFIEELTKPEILKLLKKHKIQLCFENAQDSGCYFQSFQSLVMLRQELANKLEELGEKQLIDFFRFCFDVGHYMLYQQRDGFSEEDWEEYHKEFLANTVVFHLHANDGSKDQHLLPYSESKNLPETKYPFIFKNFFENSHLVLEWLKRANEIPTNFKQFLVLEVDPYFTYDELVQFWQKWKTEIELE